MKRLLIAGAAAIVVATAAWFAVRPKPRPLPPEWTQVFAAVDGDFVPTDETAAEGEALSHAHCAACHLRPAPDALPRRAWLEVFHILTGRFNQSGVLWGPEQPAPGADTGIETQRLSMPRPAHRAYQLPKRDYLRAMYYYLTAAPEQSLPQTAKPEFSAAPAPFAVIFDAPAAPGTPQYTLAAIDAGRRKIVLGDSAARALTVIDGAGKARFSLPLGGVSPTSLTLRADGVYVVTSGPTYESIVLSKPDGRLLRFPAAALEREPAAFAPEVVIGALRYPLHATFGDLDGDGADDVVIEEFGLSDGALAWHKRTASGYEKHVLFDGPGALATALGDFTGDGRPDVLAIVAQADEKLLLYENRGEGFDARVVAQQQPAFGHDGMSTGDFDGDGGLDLVVANGDNDLEAAPLRNYHGIRVWRNAGAGAWQEAFFYPLHGALQSVVRDFDGDGDQDLVATAFYPDPRSYPPETAVYLENRGGFVFVPHRIEGTAFGKWAVVGAGDLDGDGDDDLVLGALYLPGMYEQFKRSIGTADPLAYAVLRNTTR